VNHSRSHVHIVLVVHTLSPAASCPQVHVAGGFNNWSDSATPLKKQPDGSFADEVPIPWGEKQAFKYVVDGGEWLAWLDLGKRGMSGKRMQGGIGVGEGRLSEVYHAEGCRRCGRNDLRSGSGSY
jgi:hypothetical protein